MKRFSEICESPRYVLPALLLGAAVLFASAKAMSANTSAERPQLMFVQIADDLKVDPGKSTIRLVKVSQQTLYFSDRLVRIAGHVKMSDYLEE